MFARRALRMEPFLIFHPLETNMNSIRKLLAGVLAAGALLTAGAGLKLASAADESKPPPPAGGHGWHHHGLMQMYSKLGLSDAQKAQIKTIMQSAHPQLESIHQQM